MPGIVPFVALGGSWCPKPYGKFSLLVVRKFLIWLKSVFLEDLPFLVSFLFSRLSSYAGV